MSDWETYLLNSYRNFARWIGKTFVHEMEAIKYVRQHDVEYAKLLERRLALECEIRDYLKSQLRKDNSISDRGPQKPRIN